jgi:hypothetical protein
MILLVNDVRGPIARGLESPMWGAPVSVVMPPAR